MINVVFDVVLPLSFVETMMDEMISLAAVHGVCVLHRKVETYDGSLSPPGFASCALIDESHMSAHCYSDQGQLAFDVFTCGSQPDSVRKVARDILLFLKANLGPNAKFYTHYLLRFPKVWSEGRWDAVAPFVIVAAL
jgi:S-adenosylmethionine/arginine decarboxylase-like enzyme